MIPILKKWVAIITATEISKIKVTIGEIYFLSIDLFLQYLTEDVLLLLFVLLSLRVTLIQVEKYKIFSWKRNSNSLSKPINVMLAVQ